LESWVHEQVWERQPRTPLASNLFAHILLRLREPYNHRATFTGQIGISINRESPDLGFRVPDDFGTATTDAGQHADQPVACHQEARRTQSESLGTATQPGS